MGVLFDQLDKKQKEAVEWKVHDNLKLLTKEKEEEHPGAVFHVPENVIEHAERTLAGMGPAERQLFVERAIREYARESGTSVLL